MIILAHDGSIYGDWVARYAVRFAATEPDRKLLVLHVNDGKVSPEIVDSRFGMLAGECDSFNVKFLPQFIPLSPSVYRSLRQAIPMDPDSLLVCGTRIKPRRQKYLSGTVSEKLLRMHQCPVLALRVVQPGLLGNPHVLLLALAGHRRGFAPVEPILQRLNPNLRFVHLFRVMLVNALRHPYLEPAKEEILKGKGRVFLTQIRSEMKDQFGLMPFRCEQSVMVSSDWAHEVLMQAGRLKAQLLLLGVSERSLAYRVFHSSAVEEILHKTPCDVGIYRGL